MTIAQLLQPIPELPWCELVVEQVHLFRECADIARRNATKLEAVEMLAGKTAIDNTKSGHFIQRPSGQWVKK